jgi:hypothetical protein
MSITSVQKENFARCFSVIASYRQIKLKTCAEDIELDQFGIDHSCCIDSDLIERITELEQETSYLKTLLQNAGIEYALSIVGGVSEAEPIFFWIRVSASYRKKSCGITRGSFTRTSGDA